MHSFLNAYLRGALSLAFVLVGVQARALMCSQVFQNAPLAFHSQLDSSTAAEKTARTFLQMVGNESLPLGEAIEHARQSLRLNAGVVGSDALSSSLLLINHSNSRIESVFTRVKTLETHLSNLREKIGEHKTAHVSKLKQFFGRGKSIQNERLIAINDLFNAVKSDVQYLNLNRSALEDEQNKIRTSFKAVDDHLNRVKVYVESVNQFKTSVYEMTENSSTSTSLRLQQILPSLKLESDSAQVELFQTETVKSQLESRHLESKLALDLLDFSKDQSLESLMAETAYTPDHVKTLLEKQLPEVLKAQKLAEEKKKRLSILQRLKPRLVPILIVGTLGTAIGTPLVTTVKEEFARKDYGRAGLEQMMAEFPETLALSKFSNKQLQELRPSSIELQDFFNQKPGVKGTVDFLSQWLQNRKDISPEDATFVISRLPLGLNAEVKTARRVQEVLNLKNDDLFPIEYGLLKGQVDLSISLQMKILRLKSTRHLSPNESLLLGELIHERTLRLFKMSEYLLPTLHQSADAMLKNQVVKFKNSFSVGTSKVRLDDSERLQLQTVPALLEYANKNANSDVKFLLGSKHSIESQQIGLEKILNDEDANLSNADLIYILQNLKGDATSEYSSDLSPLLKKMKDRFKVDWSATDHNGAGYAILELLIRKVNLHTMNNTEANLILNLLENNHLTPLRSQSREWKLFSEQVNTILKEDFLEKIMRLNTDSPISQ